MLPSLYHAHNSRDPEDLPFWLDLAEKSGDPILELGCGTGRVLIPLAEAGHQIYGLDSDPAMLDYLREHTPPYLASKVTLIQGDMADFKLGIEFSLIILPCNTYTTLPSSTRLAALTLVREHLLPNGLFAMSMPNPSLLRRLPKQAKPEIEDSFPHPLDGNPVQVSSAWRKVNQMVEITWIYDHLLKNGGVERLIYQVTQYIIPLREIQMECHKAGLQITAMFGEFNRSSFSSDSTYLILIAQKGESSKFL